MISEILKKALKLVNAYLTQNYSQHDLQIIREEIEGVVGTAINTADSVHHDYSYEEIQDLLATINEKESIRKNKGVYYTPIDVVEFILLNSVKLACNKLKPNNLHVLDMNGIPYTTFCYEKSVFDPTCGAGVFLLAALELKLDLLDLHHTEVTKSKIKKVVSSIKGNDVNADSITITKIRLLLCVLNRHGVDKIKGLAAVLNACYTSYDYVETSPTARDTFDIIIGNPPYVEDAKSESIPSKRYGNIYANVLENAALQLNPGGVLGFIIPLSYVSTPRMKKIRNELYQTIPEQYILSYSDRPDCLFPSVHQKLCIMLGAKQGTSRNIYTANYRYWYKEERRELFCKAEVVSNKYVTDEYIPKLGTRIDAAIYQKTIESPTPIISLLEGKETPIYLNMRAAFWIKAFLTEHTGAEYKVFNCKSEEQANLCMCILNSSLFWWYWICVSDCWHITRKELQGFRVPEIENYSTVKKLAAKLERKLEDTKLYVGTKQTEYEYKHKACVDVIHQIDDYINALYGLTEEESLYVKNFAYRYRVSGGVEDERN